MLLHSSNVSEGLAAPYGSLHHGSNANKHCNCLDTRSRYALAEATTCLRMPTLQPWAIPVSSANIPDPDGLIISTGDDLRQALAPSDGRHLTLVTRQDERLFFRFCDLHTGSALSNLLQKLMPLIMGAPLVLVRGAGGSSPARCTHSGLKNRRGVGLRLG